MVKTANCLSIKESLLAYFAEHAEVSVLRDQCVVSLPLKTPDDRFIDVFIEPKLGDYVRVHDAARTVAELDVQGLHPTEGRLKLLASVGERYGVTLDASHALQIVCKKHQVNESIMALVQCSSVAMFETVTHRAEQQQESIADRVKRTMRVWQPAFFEIKNTQTFRGKVAGATHTFDAVAYSKDRKHSTVALKVLALGYGANVQSDRYGFLALDLEGTAFNFPRIAIIGKAEEWSDGALKTVKALSRYTFEVRTGSEERIEKELPKIVERVSKAA